MRVLLTLAGVVCLCYGQRNEPLHQLFKEYYEDRLRESPELATMRGRTEYNDRWTDWLRAGVERRAKKRQEYLDRNAQLSEQDRLSARFLRYTLERSADTEPLDVYLLRIGQLFGVHTNIF